MTNEIEQAVVQIAHEMDWEDLTDHGSGSCVASHGCAGVTQSDLYEYARRLLEWERGRAEPVALLEEWSRNVRVTIRGIDGQAERLIGPPPLSNWKAEGIIVGYKLNTGLWHSLLGLLACCPVSELGCAGDHDNLSPAETAIRAMRELRAAKAQIAALEAKIDRLMLEYCPDEMTPEQIAKWEAHQKPAPEKR